jgi:hypothetical protein
MQRICLISKSIEFAKSLVNDQPDKIFIGEL